ncbi:MAG: hypothetical protein CYPHOPRED_004554, partial [Cyphobasidiales sp. Tagirdzhanova-0007]
MLAPTSALATLLALGPVLAHHAMWHPSVYGFNASGTDPANYFDTPANTAFITTPLRLWEKLTFDQWFFHGLRGATPNAIMDLPAGQSVTLEISCNKAGTSYTNNPEILALAGDFPCIVNPDAQGKPHYGDPNVAGDNGVIHAADQADAKGCALAIAYTNDVYSIAPEDFVVFSTNHTCVWN